MGKIRFHDLRHAAATLMFKQGVHPKVVQERLGHSSIVVTLDTYSHVLPSMQDDVANRLDKFPITWCTHFYTTINLRKDQKSQLIFP